MFCNGNRFAKNHPDHTIKFSFTLFFTILIAICSLIFDWNLTFRFISIIQKIATTVINSTCFIEKIVGCTECLCSK